MAKEVTYEIKQFATAIDLHANFVNKEGIFRDDYRVDFIALATKKEQRGSELVRVGDEFIGLSLIDGQIEILNCKEGFMGIYQDGDTPSAQRMREARAKFSE